MMLFFKNLFATFSKLERRVFFVAAFIAAIASLVIIGIVIQKNTAIEPAYGGLYVEGAVGQPTSLNPVTALSEADKNLVRLVFSNVTDLAEKIETDPEHPNHVFRIRLKEDIRWHDGEKLTSDDVVFTVQKIQDQRSASPLYAAWQGITAERLSELEVSFTLVAPYAFFPDTLQGLYVLPKHLYEAVPPSNWRLSEYNLQPVGSGPYRFSSYDKRPDGFIESYRFTANEHALRRPMIEQFVVEFFVSSDELLRAFNAGKLDGFAASDIALLDDIRRPYETVRFMLPSYYAVFMNQSKNPILKELLVRQALDAAIDREELIREVWNGHASIATGPIPPGSRADIGARNATRTLEYADELLRRGGWIKNESGAREKAGKKNAPPTPLKLTLTVPGIAFLVKTANIAQTRWERLGIDVTLAIQSPESILEGTMKNRDYELLMFGNVLSESFDLFSFWHSSGRFYPGLNLSLYTNKRVDTLVETIREGRDEKSNDANLREIVEMITNDHPAVFLYAPEYLYVHGGAVHGIPPASIAEPSDRLRGVASWYVKTARVLK